MKYSYDIDDIEIVSVDWYDILNSKAYKQLDHKMVKRTLEEEFSTIDRADMRYIEDIFKKYPKMKRLMPAIIKESLLFYWHPYSRID
jgi:hypothetical protein